MKSLKDHIYKLLKRHSRLWDEKSQEIDITLLKHLIDVQNDELISLLLSDAKIKTQFFKRVEDALILKKNELKDFIDTNRLHNSYTQYRNRIGLRVGNQLLSERDEVVLDFPYKDCMLEGGMDKEDQKRNEIFYNQVLAKDEIDRLLDPKVLINWKRYRPVCPPPQKI